MFANLFHFPRRSPPDYERGFIRDVRIEPAARPRNRRIERLLILCWVLIAIKSVVVIWAVRHYRIPFNPLWVIAPTVVFAALVTFVYWKRD
jgi:hypothetical protein